MTERPPCQSETVETSARRAATPRDREREQARWIVDAWTYLNEAKRALAEKGGNAGIFEAIVQADADISRMLIILLGINPENEGTAGHEDDRVAWWDSLSRDEHLNMSPGGAWFYCDRVQGSLVTALNLAAGQKRAAGAVTHLQNAQGTFTILDRKLWADRPPDFPTIGRPGIGHGSVNLACKRIYQGMVYGRRWFLGKDATVFIMPPWLPTYRRRTTAELRMQMAQYIRIMNVGARTIGAYCDIYDEPARRECRVMEALEKPLMEASEAFHFMAGGDPWTDWWRTMVDWGAWAALRLPMCGGRA